MEYVRSKPRWRKERIFRHSLQVKMHRTFRVATRICQAAFTLGRRISELEVGVVRRVFPRSLVRVPINICFNCRVFPGGCHCAVRRLPEASMGFKSGDNAGPFIPVAAEHQQSDALLSKETKPGH
ncbi:hypothetical protein TNCV_4275031 [Trichonephila clavipes]|nr:hypothetical protein TNCV_4275031 [Trichonephila clavipes]